MRLKILIVDDDPSLQQMLTITFGLDDRVEAIETSGSPEEAVGIAADFHPDIVVVDSVLDAQGSEVGEHLREVVPGARLISFSGMEREAPWADARVLKSGEGIEELKRKIFGSDDGKESTPVHDVSDEYKELRRFIHDIRNPIGAIIGFAHILKMRDNSLSPEQQTEVFDALDRSAHRLSEMVETFADRHRSQSE